MTTVTKKVRSVTDIKQMLQKQSMSIVDKGYPYSYTNPSTNHTLMFYEDHWKHCGCNISVDLKNEGSCYIHRISKNQCLLWDKDWFEVEDTVEDSTVMNKPYPLVINSKFKYAVKLHTGPWVLCENKPVLSKDLLQNKWVFSGTVSPANEIFTFPNLYWNKSLLLIKEGKLLPCFRKDDKVLVRFDLTSEQWAAAHFSHFEEDSEGGPTFCVFAEGKTSHTTQEVVRVAFVKQQGN
jgi:hypothetical protein